MGLLTILLISLSLSMDAFAVSVARGCPVKENRLNQALEIALFFGLFQAVMPIFGWVLGLTIRGQVAVVDHWVAFVLLSAVGIRMIYEGLKKKPANYNSGSMKFSTLIILSIATSIDAFVVGVSFSVLNISILLPILLIGLIAFINSFIGFYLGSKIGQLFGKRAEVLGGIVLIAIGLKTLLF